ncbi:MAG: ATP-binding protein [Kiritimatiellia bacterium]|nr:ATP-binding protein [Kiritimatiellia bacterium]
MENVSPTPSTVVFDDALVAQFLGMPESYQFDCKRIRDKLTTVLEAVVAFANCDGGMIALGLEDPDKGKGQDRVYGIQENPANWDEVRRLIHSRITESHLLPFKHVEVGCTLRDGSRGSIVVLQITKSPTIHSIVGDGTLIRLEKGNKQLTAPEIRDLTFSRGILTAESMLETVDFELLDTDFWRQYAQQRHLTRSIDEALHHVGLAKKNAEGKLLPTRAAVLLFAENPSGLIAGKAAVRVFHYRGNRIETDPNTNLVRKPITIDGPLIRVIQDALDAVVGELASGIQMGPLGFEIVQKYPVRVLREAITNAVIHRDYRLPSDIHIRIFSERIEVESPGLLVGPVTPSNIGRIGTHTRNPLLVGALREFPTPPNLDAGEGVRMMFGTMRATGLYPPLYVTRPYTRRESVTVILLNENRPSAWEQVSEYIDKKSTIGNKEVRKILETEDVLQASKLLKQWVAKGLLQIVNPEQGTKVRIYSKPGVRLETQLFSDPIGKQMAEKSQAIDAE